MGFDSTAFRHTMGRFATGVTIVSARTNDGELIGMTANSLASVSLDPPLVLFCIGRKAVSYPAWHGVTSYGISILGDDQEALARRFANPLADKWQGLVPLSGVTGVPLLPGAMASIEATRETLADGGDHDIHIAHVLHLQVNDESARPMLFYGGRFGRLACEHFADDTREGVAAAVAQPQE